MNYGNKLIRLLKKKKRIDLHGFRFKALLKNKKETYFKDVFVKEIPLIPFEMLELINANLNNFNIINQKYNNLRYNINSQCNVEIFVNYLVSKICELNLSPNFCLSYGVYYTEMNKFTYRLSEDDYCMIPSKYHKYILKKKKAVYLQLPNIPVYLSVTNYINFNFEYIYDNGFLDNNLLISIVFQIYSAIVIAYKYFKIKHNDIHVGNIMLSNTNLKYLYYSIDTKIYRIPTYGYIVKIIDWGRATYEIDELKGYNSIFDIHGECFGQYIYDRLGACKDIIKPDINRWSDIILVSHNILNKCIKFRNTKIGKLLLRIIRDENNDILDIDNFNWNIYKKITSSKFNIKPRNIFKNKLFNKYIVSNVQSKNIIYDINY